MDRIVVSSSNIHAVGYDSVARTLEVEFKSGGIYEYAGVPSQVYEQFMSAPSLGKFFHSQIRDTYPCRRVK